MSWKCDMAENTWITFSSQFLHNVMKTEFCTFLKYNADILYNLLVNSGSHLYEKVMKLWCVKICTHFLAHFIWNLPPCKKVDDHLRWWWRMTVCPGLISSLKLHNKSIEFSLKIFQFPVSSSTTKFIHWRRCRRRQTSSSASWGRSCQPQTPPSSSSSALSSREESLFQIWN